MNGKKGYFPFRCLGTPAVYDLCDFGQEGLSFGGARIEPLLLKTVTATFRSICPASASARECSNGQATVALFQVSLTRLNALDEQTVTLGTFPADTI
jgi:hypothetical protein